MTKLPKGLEKLAEFDEKAAIEWAEPQPLIGEIDASLRAARWQHARTKAEVLEVLQRAEKLAEALKWYATPGIHERWRAEEVLADWQAWKDSK